MDRSLVYIPTPGIRYLIKQAKQLRKMQFLATYGNYLALSCKEISDAVKRNEELKLHK